MKTRARGRSERWKHAMWEGDLELSESDASSWTFLQTFLWNENFPNANESSKSKSEFRPSTLMFGLSGLGVNQTSLKIQDGSSRFEDRAGRSSTHYHSVELSHLIIRKIHKNSQKFMNNHVTQVRIRTCQWLS